MPKKAFKQWATLQIPLTMEIFLKGRDGMTSRSQPEVQCILIGVKFDVIPKFSLLCFKKINHRGECPNRIMSSYMLWSYHHVFDHGQWLLILFYFGLLNTTF